MPLVKVPDNTGHTMTLLEIDGYYVPHIKLIGEQEDNIRRMKDIQARHDDVLLCAYPKSGTHWLWEISCMLFNGRAERIPGMKEMAMLEGSSCSQLEEMVSPRILNTHFLYRQIPEDFKKKKCKIIYVLRNPKDIAVSFYNHHIKLLDYEYSADWKDYLPRFMEGKVDYGSWFDYVVDWEKQMKDNQNNPAHVLSYEDVQKDCVQEIKRLAEFLQVSGNDELYQSIADLCHFSKMKKDKDPLEDSSEWKNNKPGMYRKGKVGDWKNWFTISQNEMFNDTFKTKLRDVDIPIITRTFQW